MSKSLGVMRVIGGGALLACLVGCASVSYQDPTAVGPDGGGPLTSDFGASDLQQIAIEMTDKLLAFGPIVKLTAQRRPVLVVDKVKNKTMQHIDTESITDSIRARLINSEKFRFIDRTTDAAAIAEVRTQQESGLVDPNSAVQFGQQFGAEFMLTANLTQITESSGNRKDVWYKYTMSLKNLSTGIVEWSNEQKIRKVENRGVFGM